MDIDMLDGADLFADILEEPCLKRGKRAFIPTKNAARPIAASSMS